MSGCHVTFCGYSTEQCSEPKTPQIICTPKKKKKTLKIRNKDLFEACLSREGERSASVAHHYVSPPTPLLVNRTNSCCQASGSSSDFCSQNSFIRGLSAGATTSCPSTDIGCLCMVTDCRAALSSCPTIADCRSRVSMGEHRFRLPGLLEPFAFSPPHLASLQCARRRQQQIQSGRESHSLMLLPAKRQGTFICIARCFT